MRARQGKTPGSETGVFRGLANRVVDLAQHAINFGVPTTTPRRGAESDADDAQDDELLLLDEEEPQEPTTGAKPDGKGEPQPQARGGVLVEAASGHGSAYDDLARRLARMAS